MILTSQLPEEAIQDLPNILHAWLLIGLHSPSHIGGMALHFLVDQGCDPVASKPIVDSLLAEAVEAKLAEQKNWPPVTDCDRLDRAFQELERTGIETAHFCDPIAMTRAIKAAHGEYRLARGSTWYDSDAAREAVNGKGLNLCYASAEEREAALLKIGTDVEEALEGNGLVSYWNGSTDFQIGVVFDWKRRTPGI